jgi:hypothetical protein
MSQVMWMWHDVHRNDCGRDVDLNAQVCSPGEGSLVAGKDECNAFLHQSGDPPGGT